MGKGAKGVRPIAYCAVYGEEWNGEWESSVVIEMPTLEKTPDPFSFPAMDDTSLDLQLGDSGNKQIKKIPISHRTLLAFRDKLDGDVEQG